MSAVNIDLFGKDAIISIIKKMDYKSFVIHRQGEHKRGSPVFIYNARNAVDAVTAFNEWANNLLDYNPTHSIPYDIVLASADINEEEEEEAKVPRAKKDKRISFTFALNNPYGNTQRQMNGHKETIIQQSPGNYLTKEDIPSIIQQMKANEQENAVLAAIGQLRKDMKQLEEDFFEEEGEEEPEQPKQIPYLDQADKLVEVFRKIKSEVFMLPVGPANAGISGPPQTAKPTKESDPAEFEKRAAEIRDNITVALEILIPVDPIIDQHLLKLAELAENDPDKFNMLIGMLQNMEIPKKEKAKANI